MQPRRDGCLSIPPLVLISQPTNSVPEPTKEEAPTRLRSALVCLYCVSTAYSSTGFLSLELYEAKAGYLMAIEQLL